MTLITIRVRLGLIGVISSYLENNKLVANNMLVDVVFNYSTLSSLVEASLSSRCRRSSSSSLCSRG
jgi:hypothetical protein